MITMKLSLLLCGISWKDRESLPISQVVPIKLALKHVVIAPIGAQSGCSKQLGANGCDEVGSWAWVAGQIAKFNVNI